VKQRICANLCAEQMGNIWCKNIHAFLRYSDLRVGTFYFASPCMCLYLCTCCYVCQVLKVDHNNLVEIPSLLGRLERLTSFSCASQRPRVRLLPGSVTRLRQLQVSSNAFFPRDAMYKRGLCRRTVSVRLSVSPSRSWTVSNFFHHRVANTILIFSRTR